MEFQVLVHRDEETDSFWASVVELPGCFASGKTEDELLEALAEAIGMYMEDLEPTTVRNEVEVRRYRQEDTGLVPA